MRDEVDANGHPLPDSVRVTRIGKLLRNTHLDELPQLWNILMGEMSFIGPRPEMESIHAWVSERVPGFEQRLSVRPGITGLAQTTQGYTGLEEGEYAKKLELDLEFIENRSLSFEMQILVRTAVWMMRGRGWRWREPAAEDPESSQTPSALNSPTPEALEANESPRRAA